MAEKDDSEVAHNDPPNTVNSMIKKNGYLSCIILEKLMEQAEKSIDISNFNCLCSQIESYKKPVSGGIELMPCITVTYCLGQSDCAPMYFKCYETEAKKM